MDLALLLTQTKVAVDIAKLIKNSSETLDKSGQKLKLAELIEALADIKMQTAEIKSLIIEKDEKIQSLENKLKLKNDLKYEAPYYWLISSDEEKDGPFCQKCYDADKKLIRLQEHDTGQWSCAVCKNYYKDDDYSEEELSVRMHSPFL